MRIYKQGKHQLWWSSYHWIQKEEYNWQECRHHPSWSDCTALPETCCHQARELSDRQEDQVWPWQTAHTVRARLNELIS